MKSIIAIALFAIAGAASANNIILKHERYAGAAAYELYLGLTGEGVEAYTSVDGKSVRRKAGYTAEGNAEEFSCWITPGGEPTATAECGYWVTRYERDEW